MRREYLDVLRGLAVLIMIEAHTLDAWTRTADRVHPFYEWSVIVGGFGAPLFLLLAGIAIPLAASARLRRGLTEREVVSRGVTRGLQIFGLAFLFRLQSWVISGGPAFPALLKVDILNVMGLAIVAGALIWHAGGRLDRSHPARGRVVLFAAAAVACTMLTPIVRAAPALAMLPDPVEWYLRPHPGRTTFTLLPWAGFLLAGGAIGVLLEVRRDAMRERLFAFVLMGAGASIAAAGYLASYLPAIYANTNFWTSSPTFFFLRLGILIAATGAAWFTWRAGSRHPAVGGVNEALAAFGRASFFIYWIHVEMVYGVLSSPIHRRLPLPGAVAAYVVFSALMFGAAQAKERFSRRTVDVPSAT